MSMTKFSGSTPPLRITAPPPCMNPVSKSGKPREETPPCTTLFPNPESREEEKKSHSWQNPTEEKNPPQLEEPHLHEPVSKSGKPREEKKNDTVGRRSWKNPTCTNPFPNPESRGRKKKMTQKWDIRSAAEAPSFGPSPRDPQIPDSEFPSFRGPLYTDVLSQRDTHIPECNT